MVFKDNITEKYYVKDLTADTNIQIDVDAANNKADSFNVENSNATMTITKINTKMISLKLFYITLPNTNCKARASASLLLMPKSKS